MTSVTGPNVCYWLKINKKKYNFFAFFLNSNISDNVGRNNLLPAGVICKDLYSIVLVFIVDDNDFNQKHAKNR